MTLATKLAEDEFYDFVQVYPHEGVAKNESN